MNLETEISRELWQAVRRSYESQAWSNAILDSIHFLSDALRLKTGLQSDGTALVGQALGGKAPKLRLNRLQTESEKNIQAGVEQLLRGLYQAVRNPRSHERLDDNQTDADTLILFVDYLLRLIGHARSTFSVDECVMRIIEENFVPNERYAELLAGEIPAKQRLQVGLTVYQKKTQTEGKKLRYFFNSLIPIFTEEEKQDFFEAVSAELRENSDEKDLLCLLQLLNPEYWPLIDEVPRIRTENRIIRNLQDGRHASKTGKCLAGSMATWSRNSWSHFTLKHEVIQTLVEKLRSSSKESQDYVLTYFFGYLNKLADKPPYSLQSMVAEHLSAGDTRFEEALDTKSPWEDELWGEKVKKARDNFQPSQDALDDDIPF